MKKPAIDLQSLINAQEMPAVIIDADYRIVAANSAYCVSYGIDPAQVVHHRCHEVSHHSQVPCHMNGEDCPHKQVFTTNKPFEVLHTHYDYNNNPDRVRIKAYPLKSAGDARYLMETIIRLTPSLDISCEDMRMVGSSPSLLACIENLTVAAKSDAPVLIYGESGVGKELAAQFVHQQSRRSGNAYVELNCAAISEALCESELFGHERGAFTGCVGAKQGLFEQADGGTLFLDEIAETPLPVQAKLLRFLDSGEFRRIGDKTLLKVDVRVVAATNRNLLDMVSQGKFREDLYFRIAGIKVSIPPLRERRMDIPALAQVLLNRLGRTENKTCELGRDAVERLVNYNFPGNIRELRSILQKAMALSSNGVITAKHIHLDNHIGFHFSHSMGTHEVAVREKTLPKESAASLSLMESRHIARLLHQYTGNRRTVANILGISERTLYRKIKQYKIGLVSE